jgi:hypothetical protein
VPLDVLHCAFTHSATRRCNVCTLRRSIYHQQMALRAKGIESSSSVHSRIRSCIFFCTYCARIIVILHTSSSSVESFYPTKTKLHISPGMLPGYFACGRGSQRKQGGKLGINDWDMGHSMWELYARDSDAISLLKLCCMVLLH